MILIDPGYQPAPVLPVLQPVKPVRSDPLFPLDREIVNFLRDQPEAVRTWQMVNAVAAALRPANRSESRELKKRILARITPLIYTRHLRRVGCSALSKDTVLLDSTSIAAYCEKSLSRARCTLLTCQMRLTSSISFGSRSQMLAQ
jgi:hypothetical protein